MRSIYLNLKSDILTFTTRRQLAANGVLKEMWTTRTSSARLSMRGSIEVRFPNFRSVTFKFSSLCSWCKSTTKRNHFSIFWNVQRVITNNVEDKGLSSLADKTRIFATKSKDKLCHDKFLFRLLQPHLKKSRQIPSVPDLFIRPASTVAEGFPTSNFQDLANWLQFHYMFVVAYTTKIDKFITVLFIRSILHNFYPGQILLAVRLKICSLRPNLTQEVWEETRSCFFPHFFCALASSCALYKGINQFQYQYCQGTDHACYYKSFDLV